jgi:hypothetical protein
MTTDSFKKTMLEFELEETLTPTNSGNQAPRIHLMARPIKNFVHRHWNVASDGQKRGFVVVYLEGDNLCDHPVSGVLSRAMKRSKDAAAPSSPHKKAKVQPDAESDAEWSRVERRKSKKARKRDAKHDVRPLHVP